MRRFVLLFILCASCGVTWWALSRLGKENTPDGDRLLVVLGGGHKVLIPEKPPQQGPTIPESAATPQQGAGRDPVHLDPPKANAEQEVEHLVRAGETLWSIAREKLGSPARFHDLAEWNQLREPYQLQAGQRLRLQPRIDAAAKDLDSPAASSVTKNDDGAHPDKIGKASPSKVGAEQSREEQPRVHEIVKGETLASLAARFLGSSDRWPEIQNLNKIDDPSRVRAGTSLLIPER